MSTELALQTAHQQIQPYSLFIKDAYGPWIVLMVSSEVSWVAFGSLKLVRLGWVGAVVVSSPSQALHLGAVGMLCGMLLLSRRSSQLESAPYHSIPQSFCPLLTCEVEVERPPACLCSLRHQTPGTHKRMQ